MEENFTTGELAVRIILIILVVLFSGTCSGMTVGLFALDESHLKVKARSGTPWQRSGAKRILFFVQRAHWSLVTLLVSNAMAMTTLPILLDVLVSPTIAIILSVTAVLFFGEVIPQALFVRHGFAVISTLTPLLFILLVVTTPFSYPCAKLLDYVVGHQALAAREEIERHVRIAEGVVGDDGEDGEDGSLLPEEIQVMRGALQISKKTVRDIRGVSVDDAFMLPANSEISKPIVDQLVREGKSRVPVYMGSNRSHIVGVLLTKSLLSFAYTLGGGGADAAKNASFSSDKTKLPKISDLPLREPFRVQEDSKVSDVLNSFKTGQSHLAAVYNKQGLLVKFVTLDDIFQLLHSGRSRDESAAAAAGGGGGGGASPGKQLSDAEAVAAAAAASGEPPSVKSSNSLNNQGRDALVASAFQAIRQSQAATAAAAASQPAMDHYY